MIITNKLIIIINNKVMEFSLIQLPESRMEGNSAVGLSVIERENNKQGA